MSYQPRPQKLRRRRVRLACASLLLLCPLLNAAAQPTTQPLPAPLAEAWRKTQLPLDALSLVVESIDQRAGGWRLNAEQQRNPASLFKLVTSLAALDLLGPQYSWPTQVWIQGQQLPGSNTLDGDLIIKGHGDPKLVLERLWLLLRQVQARGILDIRGRIVLDNNAFLPSGQQPADFDGEPWRAGNVQPEALLFNYKVQTYRFRPDPARGLAWIEAELPLPDPQLPASVPLRAGACTDWRAQLKPNWTDKAQTRFAGGYPATCGVQRWPVADPEPASFNHRLIAALWQQMGGRLGGGVIAGTAPNEPPSFELRSPALAELLRDINKYSNNLMADQLFLSLARPEVDAAPVDMAQARERLAQWLSQKLAGDRSFVIERGSGLSRSTRLSAAQLALLLRQAWQSAWMPEFIASLPLSGLDGTLIRADAQRLGPALGRAHLKTGSLRDVQALAGYVQSISGKRWLMVAIVNHPQAAQSRPFLETLQRWLAEDGPPP